MTGLGSFNDSTSISDNFKWLSRTFHTPTQQYSSHLQNNLSSNCLALDHYRWCANLFAMSVSHTRTVVRECVVRTTIKVNWKSHNLTHATLNQRRFYLLGRVGRGLPKLVPGLPKRRGSFPWSPRIHHFCWHTQNLFGRWLAYPNENS